MSSAVKKENSSTKKSKLHPRDWDGKDLSSSKKIKTGQVSKSKISTQKKCEVTFSDSVVEIKENSCPIENKENVEEVEKKNQPSTPMKHSTPNSNVYKSVKDHVKTPFSKVKDNSCDPTPRLERSNLANKFAENNSKLSSSSKEMKELKFDKEVIPSDLSEKEEVKAIKESQENVVSKGDEELKTSQEKQKEEESDLSSNKIQNETAAKIENTTEKEQSKSNSQVLIEEEGDREGVKLEESNTSQNCLTQNEEK